MKTKMIEYHYRYYKLLYVLVEVDNEYNMSMLFHDKYGELDLPMKLLDKVEVFITKDKYLVETIDHKLYEKYIEGVLNEGN